jgi:predicted RNA-binding Zn ribbon-like protein
VGSTPALVWDEVQPHLVHQGGAPSPARALGVLAEAVATLLAEGDFTLVRQCEHPECVLWFYDRTKSHRRRWCSMALCGNRHKAAQFRARNRPGAQAL